MNASACPDLRRATRGQAGQAPEEVVGLFADKLQWAPRTESRPHMFFRLVSMRIQACREENEIRDRELMAHGLWL